MKRYLIVIVLLITTGTGVWAKGPQGVSGSKHDFSNLNLANNTYAADNENEVCVFCHTPHGGKLNTQLWNRNLPSAAFTHYSSNTITPTTDLANTTRAVNQESLLCLSCHDGTVAMNSLLNYSNVTGGAPDGGSNTVILPMWGPSAIIGEQMNVGTGNYEGNTFLSDDHPISFSYYDVYNFSLENQNKLEDIASIQLQGLRFFPPNGIEAAGGKRVECSTCHDPHVNYSASGNPAYAPFLIASNQGSALCLSCHKK